MKIRCAFYQDDEVDEMPTLVAACDEYTEEAWNGIPDFYVEDKARADATGAHIRECIISVPDTVIEKLFTPDVITIPTHQVEAVK